MHRKEQPRKPAHLRLLQLLFSAVCFAGAVYQISQLAAIYFAYATSSIVELKVPKEYLIDSLTFCTRYIDVLDFEQLRKDDPQRDWTGDNLNEFWVRKYQDELSISDIFKYTPREEYFIDHVEFRRRGTFKVFECDASNCTEFFTVKRFIYLEYICYTVDANYKNETLSYEALTITPSAPGQILGIVVAEQLEKSHLIKIVSHAPNSIPYVSLQNVPVKQRLFDEKKREANYNSFVSSSVKLSMRRLPPPYDTMCENYTLKGYTKRYDAIQDCVKWQVLGRFDKLPFSVAIRDPVDLKILSYFDLENSTVTNTLFALQAECVQLNQRDDCASEIPFTMTEAHAGDRMNLKLITATSPFTKITVVTQTTFVQLVSIAMSTASTWTGFAVISLNPSLWYPAFKGLMGRLCHLSHKKSESDETNDSQDNSPVEKIKWQNLQLYRQIGRIESRVRLMEMMSTKYFQVDARETERTERAIISEK